MKDYDNFEELYNDYGTMIDIEFNKRLEKYLDYISKRFYEIEEETASHISGFHSAISNQICYDQLEVYEKAHQKVLNILNEGKSESDMSVNDEIRKLKNKIVDNLYVNSKELFANKDRLHILKQAGILADTIEHAVKSAYYQSKKYSLKNIDSEIDKSIEKSLHDHIKRLRHTNYHKDVNMICKLMDMANNTSGEIHDKCVNAIKSLTK